MMAGDYYYIRGLVHIFHVLVLYAKLLFNSNNLLFLCVVNGDDLQFEIISDLKTYFRRCMRKGGGKSLKNTQYGLFFMILNQFVFMHYIYT